MRIAMASAVLMRGFSAKRVGKAARHVGHDLVHRGEQVRLDPVEPAPVFEIAQHAAVQQAVVQRHNRAQKGARGQLRVGYPVGTHQHRAGANHRIRANFTVRPDEHPVADEIRRNELGLGVNLTGKANAQQRIVRLAGHALEPGAFDRRGALNEVPPMRRRGWRDAARQPVHHRGTSRGIGHGGDRRKLKGQRPQQRFRQHLAHRGGSVRGKHLDAADPLVHRVVEPMV